MARGVKCLIYYSDRRCILSDCILLKDVLFVYLDVLYNIVIEVACIFRRVLYY